MHFNVPVGITLDKRCRYESPRDPAGEWPTPVKARETSPEQVIAERNEPNKTTAGLWREGRLSWAVHKPPRPAGGEGSRPPSPPGV